MNAVFPPWPIREFRDRSDGIPESGREDSIFRGAGAFFGRTAKTFLQKALSNPDHRTPRLLCMDGCRIYPAAIRDLRAEGRLSQRCRRRTKRYASNRIESDHRLGFYRKSLRDPG